MMSRWWLNTSWPMNGGSVDRQRICNLQKKKNPSISQFFHKSNLHWKPSVQLTCLQRPSAVFREMVLQVCKVWEHGNSTFMSQWLCSELPSCLQILMMAMSWLNASGPINGGSVDRQQICDLQKKKSINFTCECLTRCWNLIKFPSSHWFNLEISNPNTILSPLILTLMRKCIFSYLKDSLIYIIISKNTSPWI